MRKPQMIFFLTLLVALAAAGALGLFSSRQQMITSVDVAEAPMPDSTSLPTSFEPRKPIFRKPASPTAAPEPLLPASLREEARRVGQLDDDPKASEQRLNDLARRLNFTEKQTLQQLTLSSDQPGDDRALAIELLARVSDEDVLPLLSEIALAASPDLPDSRRSVFEQIVRARAIEGLGSHPDAASTRYLQKVADQTTDAFLLDRTQRALAARRGQVSEPRDQDESALRQLLKGEPAL